MLFFNKKNLHKSQRIIAGKNSTSRTVTVAAIEKQHLHRQHFLNSLHVCVCDLTGACHCQIMDWVIPGSVDMTKVKFDAQDEDDCRHNFSILHEAFSKSGITKVCTFLSNRIALQFFFFTPHKTTNCDDYISVCVQIKQTRYNMLINEI